MSFTVLARQVRLNIHTYVLYCMDICVHIWYEDVELPVRAVLSLVIVICQPFPRNRHPRTNPLGRSGGQEKPRHSG